MHVKNLTCVNTAGIAIGSLGQYEGVFDLVENITAEDVTVRFSLEEKLTSFFFLLSFSFFSSSCLVLTWS